MHRQPVTFLEAGADSGGPVVVLLHGLASSSATWAEVMPVLGRHAHVIAPDLLGHGRSANPAAATTRSARTPRACATSSSPWAGSGPRSSALLRRRRSQAVRLPVPELVDRLVLVASGGLGSGVTLALRAATLPSAATTLQALTAVTPRWLGKLTYRAVRAVPAFAGADLEGLLSAFTSFADGGARGAFVQTARGALSWSGQRLDGMADFLAATEPARADLRSLRRKLREYATTG